MQSYAELVALLGTPLEQAFAVFLRMSAFFSLMPGFGERSVPMRIKLGLAVAMTMIVAPAIDIPPEQLNVVFMTISEIATGVLLGLSLRLFVMALQTAGAIAAQATSLAQLLGGSAAEPMPAIGHVLVIAGLALAVMTGLHVKAAQFFILSYDFIPAGSLPNAANVGQWGLERVARAFALAFSLAAPFVVLSVIYNVAIGAINRAMPQLMVAFVGAPLITAGGLIMLLLAAPLMLVAWLEALNIFLATPLGGQP